jgi:DNA mismatch repair protein MutH
MNGTCSAPATPETPVDTHRCVLDHAREVCGEALAELAATELSPVSGDLRSRPDFWVGQLQYLLCYLLVAIEQTDS